MFELPLLSDDLVQLTPLLESHAPDLELAAADGQLGDLWYTSTPGPGQAAAYIEEAQRHEQQGLRYAYCVHDARNDRLVGTTSYYDLALDVPRVAIGYTWYADTVQRTHLNSACKRLLLDHAFGVLGCATVEFHTDFHNRQSRQALERLGARQDGILRSHQLRPDGTLRDTVCFSILASEWPDVRRSLDLRISRLLRAAHQ